MSRRACDADLLRSAAEVARCTRISVVGTTGSGKSTLARQLAEALGLKYLSLDDMSWEPGWQETPRDMFLQRVREATSGDRWTIDGNYAEIREALHGEIQAVIWLDYAFPVIFAQLARRTFRRCWTKERVCNGNVEVLWRQLLTRDSLFVWLMQTYRRRRRRYRAAFASPEWARFVKVRLDSPSQTRRWLAALRRAAV